MAERYWLYAGHENAEVLKPLLLSSMHALNGLQAPIEHAELRSLHVVYLHTSFLTYLCWLPHTVRGRQRCDVAPFRLIIDPFNTFCLSVLEVR